MQGLINMIEAGRKEIIETAVACAIISPILYLVIILTLEEMAR